MTYLAAIREDLQPFPVSSDMITRKCEKHGLNVIDQAADEATILLVEIELMSQLISLQSVSEGGVSKTFNKDSALLLLKRLCTEAGVDASQYVTGGSVTFREDLS
jgi:hypothetical protein